MRIILLGPTASGKTALSLLVAEELGVPIISVDSRQCYKYTDIGTAKPSEKDLRRVPHYNISLLEPDQQDSVKDFKARAEKWEQEILNSHHHVLYVGGSTLHLQSLIRPIDDIPSANAENLAMLENEIHSKGLDQLYKKLQEVDPDYAQKMDGLNRQRIVRALDVWMQTGKPFSSFHSDEAFTLPEHTAVFGMLWDRNTLYARINARVDEMIQKGLVEEVKSLLEKGYSQELQPMNAVGYREIITYLEGKWPLEKAIEKIKTNTRRYAKRQLTWFRRWDFITWLPAQSKKIEELKEILLQHLAAMPDKQ